MKHTLSIISLLVAVTLLTVFSTEAWARPGGKPPRKAMNACKDQSEGDTCTFTMRGETITGMCMAGPNNDKLACAPEGELRQEHRPPMMKPVVVKDGTVYVVSPKPLEGAEGFESELISISVDGTKTSLILSGMVLQPELSEDETVLALASFSPEDEESQVLIIALPLTQDTTPLTVSVDGRVISEAVMGDGKLYVTTVVVSDTGTDTISLERKSYLYTIKFDGTVESQVAF